MRLFLLIVLAVLPREAVADRAAADACAADLNSVGQQIYAATAPDITASSDVVKVMRSKVRPLVRSGQISRSDAQENAQAAYQCLTLIQS